ncbi:MAG: hypothetical protein KTR31_38515 [Myxococcales bacterium]|nr:hypothetical protein [Myxococcales bacterium]
MSNLATHLCALSMALLVGVSMTNPAMAGSLDLQFAGALEFATDGTLFVGDNHRGAIYAFELPEEEKPERPRRARRQREEAKTTPGSIGNIDAKIADLLGVRVGSLEINDMAVHPQSNEIYISVSRLTSFASQPAIVIVSRDQRLRLLDMSSLAFQKQELRAFPPSDATFAVRDMGPSMPPLPRDIAKSQLPLTSLAIMDMAYHDGELFVAGVAHENFLSSLRRISVPFDGTQSVASVEMYHIAHDQYESRAPIRAMSIQEIDGTPQLVAAYTCSPVVLVPLEDIEDGSKIAARTIMDMGNGQPLDMISFEMGGQPVLFVTSNSRTPRIIPLSGLSGARVVTHEDFERGPKLDLHPLMPFGPAGKAVMFDGMPLHVALLDDDFLVSLTRDAYTGSLNLDINMASFPNRMHNFFAEMDFPQFDRAAAKPTDTP